MNIRPRLLVGSLAVAAVVSVAVGWAIARQRDSNQPERADQSSVDGSQDILKPPTIETNAVVKGEQLPDVDVQMLDGTNVNVAALRGQPMIINVWGSTCGPCKKELPGFAAAHLTYGDRVRFVGIDYLPASDREEGFARDRGVQSELLYDGSGSFIDDIGIATFPVTLFVNADGLIVRQTGQLDEAQLAALIESELL